MSASRWARIEGRRGKARAARAGIAALAATALAACGAKTGLDLAGADADVPEAEAAPDRPPEALCRDAELWSGPGKFTVVHGGGSDAEGIVSYFWEMRSGPPGTTATLDPVRAPVTTLTPDMLGDYELRLTVTDRAGQEDFCDCTVHSVVHPPEALCPESVDATPVALPVTLEGDADDDGEIVSFEWTIETMPAGASPTIAPADEPTTVFTPDTEGRYEIRFTVTDDHGYRDYCIVSVDVVGAPPLDCPEGPIVTPTRRAVTLSITVLSGESVMWMWEIVEKPAASSAAEPAPAGSAAPRFTPDKPGRYVIRGTATNDLGLSSWCDLAIDATPSGPDAICPADIETVPLTAIEFTGGGVDDGAIVAYLWELAGRPVASAAAAPRPSTESTARFLPDVAGVYTIRLTVTDDDGNTASCTFTVTAVPSEGLRIEIWWNPPNRGCDTYPGPDCDPTDVDLHLLHPAAPHWFDDVTNYDCYYVNCRLAVRYETYWDTASRTDDPRLDIDDVDGHGPENINIDEPVTGHTYTVGVHYYSDDSYGPVPVYVRIYCSTVSIDPVAEFGPVTLRRSYIDFWKVARVRWTGRTCEVTPITNPDLTPVIVTRDDAASRR